MTQATEDAILVRMSAAQKAIIKERAAEAGLTLRAYSLHKLLGLTDLPDGRPGRVPRRQEELPMTG